MDTAVVGHAATIGLHIAVLLESNHTREIVLFSRVSYIIIISARFYQESSNISEISVDFDTFVNYDLQMLPTRFEY